MNLTQSQKRSTYVAVGGIVPIILIMSLSSTSAQPNKLPDNYLQQLQYGGESVLVLKPMFTEAAYSDHGFYWYYDGRCDNKCLDITIKQGEPNRWGAYNQRTIMLLSTLAWPIMNDNAVHVQLLKNPHFLDNFDTLIVMHNEYVTQELFDAITHHRHVIYMNPNALYAKITYDGSKVKLVKGHGYPEKSIGNGFDWKYDNSPQEYNIECDNWKFIRVENGQMLNCYPEAGLLSKPEILLKMKELV